jgi:hypothetical protein
MKNIHVLPTDKPSKLLKNIQYNTFWLSTGFLHREVKRGVEKLEYQNIYITNDEEIKEGYYLDLTYNIVMKAVFYPSSDKNCKKIILTTDPKLIKEGIQAIDDEFLEWFVKNQSCEYVEVEDWYNKFLSCCKSKKECHCDKKRIVIPKEEPKSNIERLPFPELVKEFAEYYKDIPLVEEPKQETLEEAYNRIYNSIDFTEFCFSSFKIGAKYQAERMYSEEEVLELLELYDNHIQENFIPSKTILSTKKWFEKIKKKS